MLTRVIGHFNFSSPRDIFNNSSFLRRWDIPNPPFFFFLVEETSSEEANNLTSLSKKIKRSNFSQLGNYIRLLISFSLSAWIVLARWFYSYTHFPVLDGRFSWLKVLPSTATSFYFPPLPPASHDHSPWKTSYRVKKNIFFPVFNCVSLSTSQSATIRWTSSSDEWPRWWRPFAHLSPKNIFLPDGK